MSTSTGRSKQAPQPASSSAAIDKRMLNHKVRLHLLTLQARSFRDWYRPQLEALYEQIPVADVLTWQQGLSDDEKVAYQAVMDKLPKVKLFNEYEAISARLKALAILDQEDRHNVYEGRCCLHDSLDALRIADFDTAVSLAEHAGERLAHIVKRVRRSSRNYRHLDPAVTEVLTECIAQLEQLVAGLRTARTVAA